MACVDKVISSSEENFSVHKKYMNFLRLRKIALATSQTAFFFKLQEPTTESFSLPEQEIQLIYQFFRL